MVKNSSLSVWQLHIFSVVCSTWNFLYLQCFHIASHMLTYINAQLNLFHITIMYKIQTYLIQVTLHNPWTMNDKSLVGLKLDLFHQTSFAKSHSNILHTHNSGWIHQTFFCQINFITNSPNFSSTEVLLFMKY